MESTMATSNRKFGFEFTSINYQHFMVSHGREKLKMSILKQLRPIYDILETKNGIDDEFS